MKRVFTLREIEYAIANGDAFLRSGSLNRLYNAEIEYKNRVWKVTDVGLSLITLED